MVRSLNSLLLAAICVLAVGLVGCGGGGDDTGSLPGTELDPGDLVPEVQVRTVDHGYRVAGWSDENLDIDPIKVLIASATSSLDIAVPRINSQEVVEAILNEAASGVQVRIVTEKAFYDSDLYRPFYDQLEDLTRNNGNLQIRTDHEGMPRTMHARFMVIDHARVITGSYNWETSDSQYTFGDIINILNTDVAAVFTSQFNQMFVERNFGAAKRDDVIHDFRLGAGNGLLEVYFGPTDNLRTRIKNEMDQSTTVVFAVQQFSDQNMYIDMLQWLTTDIGTTRTMIGLINDIEGQGSFEENQIYQGFLNYINGEPVDTSNFFINRPIDYTGTYNEFDTMNHKHMFVDNAIIFTTANYANPDMSQNDEVLLIFSGQPLVSKFWRQINLNSSRVPAGVDEAADIQEFDQLLAMFPFVGTNMEAAYRNPLWADLPCGLLFGTVDNFRPTVNVSDGEEIEEIEIDITFDILGESSLFFGGSIAELFQAGADTPFPVFAEGEDAFVRNEIFNPDHEFIMVVPAGEITLRTTVTDLGGDASSRFEPDEQIITVAPGGVRRIKPSINQQTTDNTGGAGGGGGGRPPGAG